MKFKEEVRANLNSITTTLAEQHVTLKDHIRRTELLEEQMEPVKKHVNMVNGALKFIGLLGIAVSIAEAIHMGFK